MPSTINPDEILIEPHIATFARDVKNNFERAKADIEALASFDGSIPLDQIEAAAYQAEQSAIAANNSSEGAFTSRLAADQSKDIVTALAATYAQQTNTAIAAANQASAYAATTIAGTTIYATESEGLTATAEGNTFTVYGSGEIYATTFRKQGGVAVKVQDYPSLEAYKAIPAQRDTAPGWSGVIKRSDGTWTQGWLADGTPIGFGKAYEAEIAAVEALITGGPVAQSAAPGWAGVVLRSDGTWAQGWLEGGTPVGFGGDYSSDIAALEAQIAALETAVSATPVTRIDQTVPVTTRADFSGHNLTDGTFTSATYKKADFAKQDCFGVRLVFSNKRLSTSGEVKPLYPYTLKASLVVGGKLYPVIFNGGERSVKVPAGRDAVSDVVPVRLTAGTAFYTLIHISVASLGQTWPVSNSAASGLSEGYVIGQDLTDTALDSWPAVTTGFIAAPASIQARQTVAKPVFGIIGSSSFYGQGDVAEAPTWCLGYTARALSIAGFGFTRMSAPSDRLSYFNANNQFRRDHIIRTGITHTILGLGSNDIAVTGATYESIMASLTAALDWHYGMGIRVLLPTYTPRTTGSAGWATLPDQTVHASNDLRLAVNAAIRAGLGHPAVAGVLDIGQYFQDATETGKWRVDLGQLTNDGLHNNQYGHRIAGEYLAPIITSIMAGE